MTITRFMIIAQPYVTSRYDKQRAVYVNNN
jgi:hypothetical protein